MFKSSFIKIAVKSFIGLFVLIVTFSGCDSNGEPVIFLIPEGYTGRVTIIHNHPEDQSKKYEDGHRVFQIDENGCCLSQFELQYDKWLEKDYFLVDSVGNRTKIETNPGFKTYEEDTTGLKRVFLEQTVDFSSQPENLNFYTFLLCKSTEYKDFMHLMEDNHDECLSGK